MKLSDFVAMAVERSPLVDTAKSQPEVLRAEASAASALPEPELMFEIWQVPLRRPARVDEAGMLEVGLRQHFPAAGVLEGRGAAREHAARSAEEFVKVVRKNVAREAAHAFLAYAASGELLRLHLEHRELVARLENFAVQRFAPGGSPLDGFAARLERARIEAEIAGTREELDSARSRMNILVGRAPESDLGIAEVPATETVSVPASEVLRRGRLQRSELRVARAELNALGSEDEAARRAARLPSFDLAALYFPSVGMQREHGYGISASMSLPWLWGASRAEAAVASLRRAAAVTEQRNAILMIDREVLSALGEVRVRASKLGALSSGIRSLIEREVQLAESRLTAGAGGLPQVVEARRAALELEVETAAARADLWRAIVDLEWAVGGPVPRSALETQPSAARERSP